MPHTADILSRASAPLPHAVPLPGLSLRCLGSAFGTAFEACRRIADEVAGEAWSAAALHETGLGTSYVFRFACSMASLRFSARAAAVLAPRRPAPVQPGLG